ncbi:MULTISPECIES: hypothetical protein [Bradyrhizobium]|uniref:hypothetical protein n=1 Tax=Bradyrhizobium TaxID=374 RepID=UPI0011432575|nr:MULTISPECIES: hypothetical protein [Bradyrhizobium]UFW51520.1 hypothetical protein BaraCB756_11335 [Bradyrhizobium arachidis]
MPDSRARHSVDLIENDVVTVHAVCRTIWFEPHQFPGLRIADHGVAAVDELDPMDDELTLRRKIVAAHAQNIGECYLPDGIHFDRNRTFGFDPRTDHSLGDRNGLIATDFSLA